MCRLFSVPVFDHEAFAMNALEQALLYCARANPLGAHGGLDSRVIKALEQIGAHLAGPLGVPRLARDCGLSTSRLAHLFQEQVGMPPRDYIEQERLRRARELLETSAQTVSEIAYAVGFSSPSYFSRRFTAIVGSMPREYRRRMRVSVARSMHAADAGRR
jgi:AraC family transcriptional regulator of arabinose operon